MPRIKLNKHELYKLLSEHLDWFDHWDETKRPNEMRYIFSRTIETNINLYLKKNYNVSPNDPDYDPPTTKIYGATLATMVNDGVLRRKKYYSDHDYRYCPVLPIDEEYFA